MKKRKKTNKMQQHFTKRLLMYIVYTSIIVMLTYFTVKVISGGCNNIFGYTVRMVISGSMEPDIKVNSISIVKVCDINEIKEGDIVCFNCGSDIIHRVIAVSETDSHKVLHTKGDANKSPDSIEVSDDMLIGKVVLTLNSVAGIIERYSIEPGRIDTALLARNMILAGFVTGLIVLCISWLVSIARLIIVTFTSSESKTGEMRQHIDKYINDIDELMIYRGLLLELKEKDNGALEKIARTKAIFECNELHESIKQFKKSIKRCLYVYDLSKGLSKKRGKTNTIEETDNVEESTGETETCIEEVEIDSMGETDNMEESTGETDNVEESAGETETCNGEEMNNSVETEIGSNAKIENTAEPDSAETETRDNVGTETDNNIINLKTKQPIKTKPKAYKHKTPTQMSSNSMKRTCKLYSNERMHKNKHSRKVTGTK